MYPLVPRVSPICILFLCPISCRVTYLYPLSVSCILSCHLLYPLLYPLWSRSVPSLLSVHMPMLSCFALDCVQYPFLYSVRVTDTPSIYPCVSDFEPCPYLVWCETRKFLRWTCVSFEHPQHEWWFQSLVYTLGDATNSRVAKKSRLCDTKTAMWPWYLLFSVRPWSPPQFYR